MCGVLGRGYSFSIPSFRANTRLGALYPTEDPCLGNRVFAAALSLNLAILIAASAGVDVRTSAQCPSAQGISERLVPLLPPTADADAARDVALVEVIETRPDGNTYVLIRLLRPDTSEIGNRRVMLDGTCQDKAEAVAAILAAWETDPGSDSSAVEEPETPPATNQAQTEPVVVSVPAPTPDWNLLVGAGAGAALVGGAAAHGTLEATAGRRDSHWSLRLGVSAQTARTIDLSTGQADWQHTDFALTVMWRTLGVWPLSFDAGPVLGWASLSGTTFTPNRQQRVFEYGATIGARLGRTWGRWTVWAEARATSWFLEEQATAKASDTIAKDLPPVDATASLGLSLALFP
jgi:hypothetical protein